MQSLTIYSEQQVSILEASKESNPGIVPFLDAFNSKLVRDASDSEILITLAEIVSKTTFDAGNTPKSSEEIKALIGSLLPDCKMFFKTLTLDELKLAANRGVRGMYGDMIGVSVASLSKVFNGYMADMKRQEAKKALIEANTPKEEPPKEVSESEWVRLSIEAFEKFKESGVYEDWGNIIYLFLERKGLLNYSNERKAEIKRIVENRELARLSAPLSMEEKRNFEKLKDQLLSGSMDIKGKCRREALLIYFKELDEMGLAMEDLLYE